MLRDITIHTDLEKWGRWFFPDGRLGLWVPVWMVLGKMAYTDVRRQTPVPEEPPDVV